MNKKLQLNENTVIKTECWTHMKMAIIQTLPNYENWLYSHINIYYDPSRGEVFFGSCFNPEQPEYYSDILDIEELEFHKMNSNNIIDFIQKQINDDCYFIVMIRDESGFLHESFIYGYDDDMKVFDSFSLDEHGHFDSTTISYQRLQDGFKEALYVFKNDPNSYYFSRSFCFLMARIKPQKRYVTRNYAPEYFAKLCNEAYGTRAIFQCSDRDETYLVGQNYYTGISCLLVFKDLLDNISNNSDKMTLNRLRRSFFKLYEHRCIIAKAMMWYEKQWAITDNEIVQLRKNYFDCCDEMFRICLMLIKFEQTLDCSLINRIKNEISKQYYNEKVILDRYVIIIRKWYFDEVLSNQLQEAE